MTQWLCHLPYLAAKRRRNTFVLKKGDLKYINYHLLSLEISRHRTFTLNLLLVANRFIGGAWYRSKKYVAHIRPSKQQEKKS